MEVFRVVNYEFIVNPHLPHFSGIIHLPPWGWGQLDSTAASKDYDSKVKMTDPKFRNKDFKKLRNWSFF